MASRHVLVSRVVLSAALFGTACAGPTGRPPQPDAPSAVQQELGYRNVLQAGAEYARMQGYQVAEAQGQAVEVRPNIWRVRFGLPERGSGKLLELEFDEEIRQVVRAQEIEVVPSVPEPGRGPQ